MDTPADKGHCIFRITQFNHELGRSLAYQFQRIGSGTLLPDVQHHFSDAEIDFIIHIPCLQRVDLKHHRPLSKPVAPGGQMGPGEDIHARILFEYWRQILCLKQDRRVMIDRPPS